jgi:hypothetical protein
MVTTRSNLQQRLSGIAFDSMPKTCQDAVEVARNISVRYLWIDGLCIIQGDAEDWTRESKRMGSIYQMACLVIAASGAVSPKNGCFLSTPRDLGSVDLPFYSSTGQRDGCFHACGLSWEKYQPVFGPLSSRGWALQESYLARRCLSFMPGGPSWTCKNSESAGLTERNTIMNRGEYPDWESILQRFSCTKLTRKSDRLMAVEGMATELNKKLGDTYNRGVFLSRIASHLLWMVRDISPQSEDLTDVPSWSWASNAAEKLFWGNKIDLEPDIDESIAHIDSQGCLKLQGYLGECKLDNTALENETIGDSKTHNIFRAVLLFLHFLDQAARVFVQGTALNCSGIAVFDREIFNTIHCFCLMSTTLERLMGHTW